MDRIVKKIEIKFEATFDAESEADLHEVLGAVKSTLEVKFDGDALMNLQNTHRQHSRWSKSILLKDVEQTSQTP
jgi:hypothetical protein